MIHINVIKFKLTLSNGKKIRTVYLINETCHSVKAFESERNGVLKVK
jgi:hypothetical protein